MKNAPRRPEGVLIARVIDKTPGMSRRSVADAVGLSEARVRQIINGYASAGRGQSVDVVAPPATLAKIAAAVGITRDQLVQAGRKDAADALAEQIEIDRGRGVVLDANRYDQAWASMSTWLKDEKEEGLHPPVDALWLWTPRQLAQNLLEQVALLEAAHDQSARAYFGELVRGKDLSALDDTDAPDKESDRDGSSPAPTREAGGTPAAGVRVTQDDVALAAMSGTPDHMPDTTTGEESQDPGTDEPA